MPTRLENWTEMTHAKPQGAEEVGDTATGPRCGYFLAMLFLAP